VVSGSTFGLDGPSGISSDGTHVWVANYYSPSVTELDASTGALVQVISGNTLAGFDYSNGISSDGTDVWVTDSFANSVAELDASTGALVQVISGESSGFERPIDISSEGTHVWVTNYNGNDVTELSTVSLEQQTITFASLSPTDAFVGGPTYSVSATGGASGNPVAFSIDSSATYVCSISGSTVGFIGPGTCTIDANQAGNNDYAAASPVQQSFSVGGGSQAITITSTPPSHATPRGATYTVNATGGGSGNPVTFSSATSSVCSVSGSTVGFSGVGTCTIDANEAGNGDYLEAPTATQSFSVKNLQTITPCTNTTATVGSLYSCPVTATGLPIPSLSERGKLPKGVHFGSADGTRSLYGTPTSTKHKSAVGTYSITFTATFGRGKSKVVVEEPFTLTVN
jgi:hypothetical protein